jgi:hypothetical protein
VVSVTTSIVVDSVVSPDPQDASVKVDRIASAMKILFIGTRLNNKMIFVKRVSKKKLNLNLHIKIITLIFALTK